MTEQTHSSSEENVQDPAQSAAQAPDEEQQPLAEKTAQRTKTERKAVKRYRRERHSVCEGLRRISHHSSRSDCAGLWMLYFHEQAVVPAAQL